MLSPFFRKVANSFDQNCGPLSGIICSGRPYTEKIHCNTKIMQSEIVELISHISGHFERTSINEEHLATKKASKIDMKHLLIFGRPAQECSDITARASFDSWHSI